MQGYRAVMGRLSARHCAQCWTCAAALALDCTQDSSPRPSPPHSHPIPPSHTHTPAPHPHSHMAPPQTTHPCAPLRHAELAIGYYDPANVGVGEAVLRSPTFWFVIMLVYVVTFGMRFAERTAGWVFRPHDTMILAEKERKVRWRAGGQGRFCGVRARVCMWVDG